jgi:hypothetical protein
VDTKTLMKNARGNVTVGRSQPGSLALTTTKGTARKVAKSIRDQIDNEKDLRAVEL